VPFTFPSSSVPSSRASDAAAIARGDDDDDDTDGAHDPDRNSRRSVVRSVARASSSKVIHFIHFIHFISSVTRSLALDDGTDGRR
jgi:hypothetical protein